MIRDYILVFVATTFADVFWARYGLAVAARAIMPAATWSVAIVLLSCFTVSEYTSNHWLVIPAAFGAAIGTMWGLKYGMPEPPLNTKEDLIKLFSESAK